MIGCDPAHARLPMVTTPRRAYSGGVSGSVSSAGAHPGRVDPATMRDVLGHFVSGVVVVTAVGDDGPVGFTCQSFASLSLDPPLVNFSPARTSSTWPRIRTIGRFCINILAADHRHYSAGFARSGRVPS